jgi:hypothetical protein
VAKPADWEAVMNPTRTTALSAAALSLALVSPAFATDLSDEWPDPLDGSPRLRIELKQWGLGPFEVRDPSILGQLRAAPMARSPRTLEPGVIEVGLRQTQESTFQYADDSTLTDSKGDAVHRLTVDGETRDTHLVFRMGVLPRIELGAELDAVRYQGGGFLDGLIQSFHQSFGMNTMRRDRVRSHSWNVDGVDPDGHHIHLNSGTGVGDAYLSARFLVTEGSDYIPAVAATFSLWVPTASPQFQHAHGTAETLSIDASKRIGQLPIVLYFGGAFTYYDQAAIHGLQLTRQRGMGYFGFEWELTNRVSLVTHFWQESRRERKFYRDTDSVKGNEIQYIASGVKVVPVPGVRVEVGALESFDKSVGGDFGFLANVWVDFGMGGLVDDHKANGTLGATPDGR